MEGGGGHIQQKKKTTRKFSVVVGSFGGITSDDISHLDTTASLGYGQLQTCLYNRPGYLTNHQTLFGPGAGQGESYLRVREQRWLQRKIDGT